MKNSQLNKLFSLLIRGHVNFTKSLFLLLYINHYLVGISGIDTTDLQDAFR